MSFTKKIYTYTYFGVFDIASDIGGLFSIVKTLIGLSTTFILITTFYHLGKEIQRRNKKELLKLLLKNKDKHLT